MSEARRVRFTSETETNTVLKTETIQRYKRSGSINALEELVQCAICMDKLTEPKMLQCQHTFCLNCLQYHLPSGANFVACVICKVTTPLENGLVSLDALPGNLYIDSLLVLISGGVTPMTSNKMKPEMHCIKCQTVCQFSEQTCQHCKQIFCGTCWPKHLSELSENLKSLNKQLKDSHIQLMDHRIVSFQERFTQIENNIKNTADLKIQEIKQREFECLTEVNSIKEIELENLEKIKLKMIELETKINRQEFEIEKDANQKISLYKTLHQSLSLLLDEIARWDSKRTIFDSDNFKIDYEIDANQDAEIDDDEFNHEFVIGDPLETPDSLIKHYKTKSFTPKFTWTKCIRPAGIAIAPWDNNCVYIAGTDSRHIYGLHKQKGKLLFRISSPEMICPVGIAISSLSEEIFVSDKWKHCIHVFSKDGYFIKLFGKKGSSSGSFRSPEGIAILNDCLFICDTGNDRIQVINTTDGSYLYSFGITSTDKVMTRYGMIFERKFTELNTPTGITITNDNKIIIADNGNRRIKIYTLEGKKITEFGTLGKSKGQFRSPEVVAVDPMGFIFVGDSGNARIQIFKPNGTLVRVFGSKGKLAWVSGICVTPQLDVIVTDYKNQTVHIF